MMKRAAAPRQLSLPLADELSAGRAAVAKSENGTSSRRVVRQFEGESAQSGCGCSGALGRADLRRNDGGLFRRWGTGGGRQAALFHPERSNDSKFAPESCTNGQAKGVWGRCGRAICNLNTRRSAI